MAFSTPQVLQWTVARVVKGFCMCSPSAIQFGTSCLTPDEIANCRVLEVGATDFNGSLRNHIEALNPDLYLGVDFCMGKGVDEICDVNNLVDRYGTESFDLVIATELLEHVRDWRNAISNLKRVLKPNGILVITTRSQGFDYHGYPHDFWRYELVDIRAIFADMKIERLDIDSEKPGVFLKARKPTSFVETNLAGIALYSIITHHRADKIKNYEIWFSSARWFFILKRSLAKVMPTFIREYLEKKYIKILANQTIGDDKSRASCSK